MQRPHSCLTKKMKGMLKGVNRLAPLDYFVIIEMIHKRGQSLSSLQEICGVLRDSPISGDLSISEERIQEAKREIKFEIGKQSLLEDVERIKREIEDMKKEIERSQRDILRNMVSIFGIFVAIFSFIIIGANVGLSIQPRGYIDILVIVFIFAVIFLLLLGLLYYVKKWFTGKKNSDY